MSAVDNIIDAWNRATPAERAAGRRWYPRARAAARAIARDAGISEARAAAIIASLSPRCQWSVNLRWARDVALAAAAGADCPAASTEVFRELAWRLATAELRPSAVGDTRTRGVGPKVARFWRNILGARDCATCDVWACKVAGVDPKSVDSAAGYALVESAYIAAAARLDVDVRTLQAATWIAERGRAE